MVKITYITVTYNAEKTLPATTASVLQQTYANIEHIIIDGASSDGTVQVAKKYLAENEQAQNRHAVTLISERDRGIYDAMNKGLKMAAGDYVCFLNAGDWLPDDHTTEKVVNSITTAIGTTPKATCTEFKDGNKAAMTETMPKAEKKYTETADGGNVAVEIVSKTEKEYTETPDGSNRMTNNSAMPAVIYGDTQIADAHGYILGLREKRPPQTLSWKSFKDGMTVCHQAFYARTDIAQKTPFNLQYRYSADFDWCIRIMKAAEVSNLPLTDAKSVIVNYLNEGTTTKNRIKSLKERLKIMTKHYGFLTAVINHVKFIWKNLTK